VVTELGSEAAIHDVTVEAPDWMTAVTMGRGRIGERGGVPPGAMCSVSAEGIVTLVDAVTRKRYRLEPTAAAPSVPPLAKPASVPPPAMVNVKVTKRTVAFDAASLGLKQVVGVGTPAPAPAPPVAAPGSIAPAAPASVVATPGSAAPSVAPVASVSVAPVAPVSVVPPAPVSVVPPAPEAARRTCLVP
jgi:hypothetical protein